MQIKATYEIEDLLGGEHLEAEEAATKLFDRELRRWLIALAEVGEQGTRIVISRCEVAVVGQVLHEDAGDDVVMIGSNGSSLLTVSVAKIVDIQHMREPSFQKSEGEMGFPLAKLCLRSERLDVRITRLHVE